MEHPSPHHHNLRHERLRGDDIEASLHQVDAFSSPRVIDELVVREVHGQRIYGEVFAIVTPDAASAENSGYHPSDQPDGLCLVRYPDTRQVGIASRVSVGDTTVMHPGLILRPDERVVFGREGDREHAMSEPAVVGRIALTGVDGTAFGRGVSRIHGSIDVDSEGRVTISDGREELDPVTRHVMDIASTNHTRVSVASDTMPREDLISPQKSIDAKEYAERRFAEIFGAPQSRVRGRFGNAQDRLTDMTPETIRDACGMLDRIDDPELKGIIKSHLGGGANVDPEAVVTLVRKNDELRFALADYLLKKASDIGYKLPERVATNNQFKSSNYPGYAANMNSQEYAVVLALSMLDGTFVTRKSMQDPVEYIRNYNGTVVNGGQHRLAALELLGVHNTGSHIKQEYSYSQTAIQ